MPSEHSLPPKCNHTLPVMHLCVQSARLPLSLSGCLLRLSVGRPSGRAFSACCPTLPCLIPHLSSQSGRPSVRAFSVCCPALPYHIPHLSGRLTVRAFSVCCPALPYRVNAALNGLIPWFRLSDFVSLSTSARPKLYSKLKTLSLSERSQLSSPHSLLQKI